MKVTRIAYSTRLNPGKYAALLEQARRLGRVRSEVWQRYGSIATVKQILQDRTDRHRTRLPVQDSSPATTERRANYPNRSAMSN
ncbi:hypothetical protein GA0070624_2603 [Micromonospora rhizosphaerae]|uniref:Uncharacterized protein n=1 Tax=Micromonospora rhizosphaerae TaxID=568872 RepID=A0A1C6S0F3_9ACTN|nr:hypothetical protein [Micromonospora rhizosphaerae]SCL22769.1 hypothetical protein GA0070624_2603 [Micromonospora rhizosphaerae]